MSEGWCAAQSISQAIVGHNSSEVHQLYTHADEDALRRAVTALPAVLTDKPAAALPPAVASPRTGSDRE